MMIRFHTHTHIHAWKYKFVSTSNMWILMAGKKKKMLLNQVKIYGHSYSSDIRMGLCHTHTLTKCLEFVFFSCRFFFIILPNPYITMNVWCKAEIRKKIKNSKFKLEK